MVNHLWMDRVHPFSIVFLYVFFRFTRGESVAGFSKPPSGPHWSSMSSGSGLHNISSIHWLQPQWQQRTSGWDGFTMFHLDFHGCMTNYIEDLWWFPWIKKHGWFMMISMDSCDELFGFMWNDSESWFKDPHAEKNILSTGRIYWNMLMMLISGFVAIL